MAPSLLYRAIPVLPLRGIVVFPGLRFHFEVGRDRSMKAVDLAMQKDQKIFLISQKDINTEEPQVSDLSKVGVTAHIRQLTKDSKTGCYKVIVETDRRAMINKIVSLEECIVCDIKEVKTVSGEAGSYRLDAAMRSVLDNFATYVEDSSEDLVEYARKVITYGEPEKVADEIANTVLSRFEERQLILDEADIVSRLEKLNVLLRKETNILTYEIDIEKRTEEQMDKNQREYYLREKMRAISHELGDGDEPMAEAQSYKTKIEALDCDEEVREKLLYECSKLSKLQVGGADASVVRVYLDTALGVPFGKYTEDNCDLKNARKQLDADHYGIDDVKKRFIEMLAVKARTQNIKGQIICLVGPPGVGKTSIVRSIADAMGRKYTRLALGGVNDEAEIRGHRKTYIGAMPGRIISALTQAKTMNPIILLDEIDKLGTSYKGDPASALLEVLDPEQNNTFRDNYLEFSTDLSKALFITTANDAASIPAALYDRMEIIELPGYTAEEKLMIAKNHLIKKQMKLHALTGKELRFTDKGIRLLIDCYTREAGVRRLEQTIASILRKATVLLAETSSRITVSPDFIREILGPEKYLPELIGDEDLTGVVSGLAYSAAGGAITKIEAVAMPGTGKLELTGSLGDVMKESAKTALSFVRSIGAEYNIENDIWDKKDIHIHAPEGAIPKDGPSAGITMATAILSAITGLRVDRAVTMTGEISLTGRVMRIGGLREKSMAAYKSGASRVIIPRENMPDLYEIDEKIKASLEFIPVSDAREVFSLALKADEKTFDLTKASVKFTHTPIKKSSGNIRRDKQ